MLQQDLKEATTVYSLLLEAKKAILCWLVIEADITYQQSAQYVREGHSNWRHGNRSRANYCYGWAGRWQKMANAEKKNAYLLKEEIRQMEVLFGLLKSGIHPPQLNEVTIETLRQQRQNQLYLSLNMHPTAVLQAMYSLTENIENELKYTPWK
jgi:hypothetical protein